MARRAIVASAVITAFLTSSVVLPNASAAGASCSDAFLMPGAAAGAVGSDKPEEWWRLPGLPGTYVVTLTSTVGDADLGVGDGDCGAMCSSSEPLGVETCTVTVETYGITVVARSMSDRVPASYVVDVVTAPAAADCADGLDNDGDGLRDNADAGCGDDTPSSEDDDPCYDRAGVDVCSRLVKGDVARRYSLTAPDNERYEVAGYVDTYRFTVAGRDVDLACVVLVAKPHGTNNFCGFGGGTFVSRDLKLYKVKPDLPDSALHGVRVKVCEADVVLSADGHDETFDAYVPC
ncbi:MAG TPA: hypothetical protein VGX28_14295 [Frankiaceae bacterium]|jgi:hypothetical protein|nr:hypothetical protein [Frankiaceae bacterium]